MSLKRKRSSESIDSSPFSNSSVSWSIQSRDGSASPSADVCMANSDTLSFWPESSSAPQRPYTPAGPPLTHVNLRTRKRYRDNRPDESAIHAHTYSLLFAGASRAPPDPASSVVAATASLHHRPTIQQQQSSLHSFWRIASPPVTSSRADHTQLLDNSDLRRCEDCEGTLGADGMDGVMDLSTDDGAGVSAVDEFACRRCRRRVCDLCAVVDTGAGRDCLQCRTGKQYIETRRKWIGGLGWVP